jgi:hypothetical protein
LIIRVLIEIGSKSSVWNWLTLKENIESTASKVLYLRPMRLSHALMTKPPSSTFGLDLTSSNITTDLHVRCQQPPIYPSPTTLRLPSLLPYSTPTTDTHHNHPPPTPSTMPPRSRREVKRRIRSVLRDRSWVVVGWRERR